MFPGADRDWNHTHLLQPHSSVLQEDRGVNGVLVKLLRSVSPEHIDFTFDIWDLETNLETFSPYGSLWVHVTEKRGQIVFYIPKHPQETNSATVQSAIY